MSRLDDLPPDQKAALSLLLRRHASYADLAALLNISDRAVHDRAHAGLAMLAPREARALTADQREEIGEFLLGQQHADDRRSATLRLLDSLPEARAWADALVAELGPVGDGALPQIPPPAHAQAAASSPSPSTAAASSPSPSTAAASSPSPSPSPGATPSLETRGAVAYEEPAGHAAAPEPAGHAAAPEPAGHAAALPRGDSRPARTAALPVLPVSRTAGAVLLAVLIAGVILAVVLIPSGGGSSKQSAASGRAPASRGEGASTNGSKQPAVNKRITLAPAEAGSHAVGVALVLSEGGKYAFYLAAEHMPPSNGFFYAVWLYNSPANAEALGKSPAVKPDGRLQGGALLPENAGSFRQIIVTRETSEHPTRPGTIVLKGPFGLH